MPDINIVCVLTQDQLDSLNTIYGKGGKTASQVLQEMWDGYDVELSGKIVHMDGCAWAQVKQVLKEELENEVAENSLLTKATE